jgi:tetratricopeptide (TPR) repeat protein
MALTKSFHELMSEAGEAEQKKELEKAAKLYEQAIKKEPHEEQAYHRLMVIYRKLTWYEEELQLIKKGIAAFQEFYQKKADKILEKHGRAAQISNALAKELGQRGKKTAAAFYKEPLPKWMKRQKTVEKKLGIS